MATRQQMNLSLIRKETRRDYEKLVKASIFVDGILYIERGSRCFGDSRRLE
jgi:hypothetical protein